MKKYLVTGAAGFIGSCVAKRLRDSGSEVWTIDNLSTGYEENIPKGVIFIKGDCQDVKTIESLKGAKFDAIVHIAGQSSGEISFEDPVYDLRTNTEATLLLVDFALKTGCERFIYASSMSVYGKVEDAPIAESHPCCPLSFYAVGKLASEHYLRIYRSRGLKPTCLRLFNVYGPGQNMNNLKQGMASIFLAQLLANKEILVKGPLDRFRDLIYIDDVVDAFIKCLVEPKSIGAIYNVGTGKRTTVGHLIELIIEISKINGLVKQAAGTPGDQAGIYANAEKINADINFSPKTPLDLGLRKMIEWAKKRS